MKTPRRTLQRLIMSSAIVVGIQITTGCATRAPELVSEQSTQAVLWMQNAGEYQALCYQAFNTAKDAVDQAKQTKPWAVVVDLDETMIDNSPYAAWLLLNQTSYQPDTWAAWCEAAEAPAIPGALEFANYVINQGGSLFYVSNREHITFEATQKNLRELGFPEVNETHMFLKKETSNKQPRFQRITDAGYDIVLILGDNLNDFPELNTWHKSNADRNASTIAHQSKFGPRCIVLPNPSYGDWESGLTDGYHILSPENKLRLRQDKLRTWSGE
ncbi:MAG: 5'-nucleotidase, lipoprotein e(P4) family [Opitutaceae bacterium]